MNEEEKLKNIEEILELCRKELPYNEDISATLDCEDLKSLECLYNLYQQEKEENRKKNIVIIEYQDLLEREDEKNKKLEEVTHNLAQAIRFMSTNEKLTVEDIIKEFSRENEVTEEFMQRWEKSQYEESHLKDKVIDMMATFIGNEDIDEKICKNVDECYRDNEDGDYFPCKACIKEYYFNKLKEERGGDDIIE